MICLPRIRRAPQRTIFRFPTVRRPAASNQAVLISRLPPSQSPSHPTNADMKHSGAFSGFDVS